MQIETVSTIDQYEGLRDLWCRVFGDGPEFVDYMYELFGDDIRGYVIADDTGKVVSALTCYRCGSLEGRPVYVSYAVCTDPDMRGMGLAGRLTEYVRDIITSGRGTAVCGGKTPAAGLGGISVVSPAEESLAQFYRAHGYAECCFASAVTAAQDDDEEELILGEDDDFEAFEPELKVKSADIQEYNMYREAFLRDVPHISLSDSMLKLAKSESLDGEGMLVLGGGDAICCVSAAGQGAGSSDGELQVTELIINPVLREFSEEIESEIALRLAKHYGLERVSFRRPPDGSFSDRMLQSMAAGCTEGQEFYFGFPVE